MREDAARKLLGYGDRRAGQRSVHRAAQELVGKLDDVHREGYLSDAERETELLRIYAAVRTLTGQGGECGICGWFPAIKVTTTEIIELCGYDWWYTEVIHETARLCRRCGRHIVRKAEMKNRLRFSVLSGAIVQLRHIVGAFRLWWLPEPYARRASLRTPVAVPLSPGLPVMARLALIMVLPVALVILILLLATGEWAALGKAVGDLFTNNP